MQLSRSSSARAARPVRAAWSVRRLGIAAPPRRLLVLPLLLGVVVSGQVVVASSAAAADDVGIETRTVPADGDEDIDLDTSLYVPAASRDTPAPAVILGHGFGGSKDSVETEAQALAEAGYVVLTYSARGHGASGGLIGLNDPEFEIADLSGMIDLLADRDEVATDSDGDPMVGVTGASYGGALSLLGAAYDDRIDAIVPQITWNSLTRSLFPDQVGAPEAGAFAGAPAPGEDGVFKKLWAGLFFSTASGLDGGPGSSGSGSSGGDGPSPETLGVTDLTCGRFRAEVCAAYQEAAITGRLTPEMAEILDRVSPAGVLDRIDAPTMLVQGLSDTLFPLSEADANARGIAENGTPVKMVWYRGGHDGGRNSDDVLRLRELTIAWFDHYLKGTGPDPGTTFEFPEPNALAAGLTASGGAGGADERTSTLPAYPGLASADGPTPEATVGDMPLSGPPAQFAVNPAGGLPAAISTIPGLSAGLSSLGGALGAGAFLDIPGQSAFFRTSPRESSIDIVGAVQSQVLVASPTGSAVLFAKLYDTTESGSPTLLGGVAPLRLSGLATDPRQAEPIDITLPALVHRLEVGHSLMLVLSTTDQGYSSPIEPVAYGIGLPSGAVLSVPTVSGTVAASGQPAWLLFAGIVAGLGLVLVGIVFWWGRRNRARASTIDPEIADVPLVVRGVSKTYPDGLKAVQDLSFQVRHGQVVGLLGPNGAGKTTALRMAMGLIRPSEGEIRVFGHKVTFGAPVLSRIGAFVEGTGALPHLSGKDNLSLYWAATGRPAEDAHVEEALAIAGLGAAINKRVKTYSQGMRQRLALAQAMLGLPDLLVLDEPTNGLDPPQIREMRDVLHRYVEAGRTVLISSHMLAEVEQTCTHVVVMHHGKLIAQGSVEDIIGTGGAVLLGVDDPVAARTLLSSIEGIRQLDDDDDGLIVDLDGYPRGEVVNRLVSAGIGVERVIPRRRLEDAFISLVEEDRS
ncbi:MAG: alpha/beta fold hydrolase [Actinomycetota bacterium]|nr:alpha/beta fold hydrolase [Actinomycetota bacterium]